MATPSTTSKGKVTSTSQSTSGSTSPSSSTVPPTGDTGVDNACPVGVAPLSFARCIETTATQGYDFDTGGTSTWWDAYWGEYAGTGTIVAVGGSLPPEPGAAPFYQFEACDAEHVHQVRLVDDNGDVWTFGWDATWTASDEVPFQAGEVVDYDVILSWGWVSSVSFTLSDDLGPRLFLGMAYPFEASGALDLSPWGVVLDIDVDDYCRVQGDILTARHYNATLSWGVGAAALRSGQSAVVDLPSRALEVTVPAAYDLEDCLDGCGGSFLMGWETP